MTIPIQFSQTVKCDTMFMVTEEQMILFILSADSVERLVIKSLRLYSEVAARMTTNLIQQS